MKHHTRTPSHTWILSGNILMWFSKLAYVNVCMHTHMSVCIYTQGFLGGAVVKNLPTMQETQEIPVQSLGQEDPMRRAWQPTPVFLPEDPTAEEPGGLVHRVTESDTGEATEYTHTHSHSHKKISSLFYSSSQRVLWLHDPAKTIKSCT